MATKTRPPFTTQELHWLAMGARELAAKTRRDAARPENAARREDLETDAQMLQDLAVKVQRLAVAAR